MRRLWRKMQIRRRQRIWAKRSKTNLLLNPGFEYVWRDVATDQFLLDLIERYGKRLQARLEAEIEMREFVYGLRDHPAWEGGRDEMLAWWHSIGELIQGGLVVEKEDEGVYALTHAGRTQLNSLRSAEQTAKRLDVAVKGLKIAVFTLVVSVALQILGLVLANT